MTTLTDTTVRAADLRVGDYIAGERVTDVRPRTISTDGLTFTQITAVIGDSPAMSGGPLNHAYRANQRVHVLRPTAVIV
jgi:hypothetical protein